MSKMKRLSLLNYLFCSLCMRLVHHPSSHVDGNSGLGFDWSSLFYMYLVALITITGIIIYSIVTPESSGCD